MRNRYRWDGDNKKDKNEDENDGNKSHEAGLSWRQEIWEDDLDKGHESYGNGELLIARRNDQYNMTYTAWTAR